MEKLNDKSSALKKRFFQWTQLFETKLLHKMLNS